MKDADRIARNSAELALIHKLYRTPFAALVVNMTQVGRPRLQETYRSQLEQKEKFKAGLSSLSAGGPHTHTFMAEPASLATHVLDDNNPLDPPDTWLVDLALAAKKVGLVTGLFWAKRNTDKYMAPGRPHRRALEAALAAGDRAELLRLVGKARGFDPLHVEHPNWSRIIKAEN